MIVLTKLDGQRVAVNEDLLVFAEKTPDTVITMTSGQRLMVKETLDEIVRMAAEFRARAAPSIVPAGVPHG